jgi:uncharacterized protein YndB with AHSA1/START domain
VTETGSSPTSVWARRIIDAPPEEIFEVLARPGRHAEIDGSGSVRRAVRGPERLAPGARFGMAMRIGLPYRITNTVVEFEEGRRIAWRHLGRHIWRYELEPMAGGTQVTETFDWSQVPLGAPIQRASAGRNLTAMEATLDRLAAQVGPA